MAILIGVDNEINRKLLLQLKELYDCEFLNVEGDYCDKLKKKAGESSFFFLNIIDLENEQESIILNNLKLRRPDSKLIAIHTFMIDSMIEGILLRGFDEYIPIFEFSERLALLR